MSTRCLLAYRDKHDGDLFSAVLNDGYPEHIVPTLQNIANRDGFDLMIETIFNIARNGWYSLNPDELHTEPAAYPYGAFVPGYGGTASDELGNTTGGHKDFVYELTNTAGGLNISITDVSGVPATWSEYK